MYGVQLAYVKVSNCDFFFLLPFDVAFCEGRGDSKVLPSALLGHRRDNST